MKVQFCRRYAAATEEKKVEEEVILENVEDIEEDDKEDLSVDGGVG